MMLFIHFVSLKQFPLENTKNYTVDKKMLLPLDGTRLCITQRLFKFFCFINLASLHLSQNKKLSDDIVPPNLVY